MPVPVSVYRWDDAGAPVLTGRTPAEMVNVLKKVLVEGYGSKPGLGWSVAFENAATQKIAFRNSTATVNGVTGSGGYVQFWCPEGTNTNASRFSFRTAQGMSALDSFTKPGWLENWFASNTSSTATHWLVIGNQFGFWLWSLFNSLTDYTKFGSSNGLAGGVFIGDMQSNYQNDMGRFINTSSSTSDAAVTQPNSDFHGNQQVRLYPTDGGLTPVAGLTTSNTTFGTNIDYTGGNANADDVTLGVNFTTVPYPIYVNSTTAVDANSVNVANSILQPAFRGILPGLLRSSFNGYRNKTFPQTRTINGKNHMLVAGNRPTSLGIGTWLNIEEWY